MDLKSTDLDTLISELQKLRAVHGNLQCVTYEGGSGEGGTGFMPAHPQLAKYVREGTCPPRMCSEDDLVVIRQAVEAHSEERIRSIFRCMRHPVSVPELLREKEDAYVKLMQKQHDDRVQLLRDCETLPFIVLI